jgi:hypothetical protein
VACLGIGLALFAFAARAAAAPLTSSDKTEVQSFATVPVDANKIVIKDSQTPSAIPNPEANTPPPSTETRWNPFLLGLIAVVSVVAFLVFMAMRRTD